MITTSRHQNQRYASECLSLIRYSKTSCGVNFLLNTSTSIEKAPWFNKHERYQTDFYEFYFFRKASGFMLLNGERIELSDNQTLIIAPFQQQEWHTTPSNVDYTFLVFHEDFISNFLSDKYFMYRLLYCYQHDNPASFPMTQQDMFPFLAMLDKIRMELHNPVADSYSLIVAYLVEFLLSLNRYYADRFNLPLRLPSNTYAFQYKDLLEKNIRTKVNVNDYALMIGISRITLNKAVFNEFGVTARHLLKRRLLQEAKNDILFSGLTLKEIAVNLNFSATNHLMRFFKQQTGQTIGEFLNDVKTNGLS